MSALRADRPLLLLVATFVLSVGINAYFIAPASVVPLFVDTYGVSRVAVGLAISLPLVSTIALQLPASLVIDRYDARPLVFVGTVAFVAMTTVGVVVDGFAALVATRMVVGGAFIFLFTLGTKVVTARFEGPRLATVTSVHAASAPGGFVLGQFVSPLLGTTAGLDAVFVAFTGISAVGYACFYLATPEPIRETSDGRATGGLRAVLSNRAILLVSVAAGCGYALYLFLNSWFPTYAGEVLGLSLAQAGGVVALVPLAGVVARPVGGWLSDAIGGRLPVLAGSFVVAAPVFVLVTRASSLVLFVGLLVAAGFALQSSMGVYFVHVQELAASEAAGSSLAVFSAISFSGSLVSPVLGGWLLDSFTWATTLSVYAVIGLFGILVVVASDRVSEAQRTAV